MSLSEALLTACFRKSFKVIKANINKNGHRFFKSIQDLNEKLKVKIILFLNMHKNRSHITAIQKRAQMKSLTSIFVAKKVYSPGDHVFPRVNLQLSNYLFCVSFTQDPPHKTGRHELNRNFGRHTSASCFFSFSGMFTKLLAKLNTSMEHV